MKGSGSTLEVNPRHRWRRIGKNAFAVAGARGISTLTQLAAISILLDTVGLESLGWILAVMAPVMLAQFADFGVSLAMQQAVSEANARQDPASARRAFESGRRMLAWLALGWGAASLPVAWWLGPLVLPTPQGTTAAELVWLTATLSACGSLYASAGARLAAGLQMSWTATVWTAGVNVAVLTTLWVLARIGAAAPPAIALTLGFGLFAPGWLTGRTIAGQLGWSGPTQCSSSEMRRLWQHGLPLAWSGIMGAAAHAIAPITVAACSGLASSAAFSLLQRLFGTVLQAHALLQGPFWPEYAHAATSGQLAWLKPAIKASLAMAAVTCAAVLAATVLLPWILPLWLGHAAPVIPWPLALWMAGATVAGIATQPLTYLLLGLGTLQRCGGRIALAQGITVVMIIGLGWSSGAVGVAIALTCGSALGVLPILIAAGQTSLRNLGPSPTESTHG